MVKYYIENEEYLDILEHPKKEMYPNQKMFVLDIEEYILYLLCSIRGE
jgi:hypothetical protein